MDKHHIIIMMLLLSLTSVAYAATLDSSEHVLDISNHDARVNRFLENRDSMLNFLIPAIMLLVTLVSFAIDFGTVGVSGVCVVSLVFMTWLGIVYISTGWLIAFVIIIAVMIFKINRA